jgi:O-antigen biosynthesis protein WbqP
MMIIIALRNLICIIGLLVMLPFLLFVTLLIFIEDGFPIFFVQKRIGLAKKTFTIFKIRTMKKNTPELGTHDVEKRFQLKTGRIIRAFKLDELPQLINVLKGDLNLVGPRPGLETQIKLKDARIAKNIFSVKPGITGLAQIMGYDMSNPEKLAEVDQIFILKESFLLKFMILMGTFFKYPRKYISNKYKISMDFKSL